MAEPGSKYVCTESDQKLVWRNQLADGYKVNHGYLDTPMDLSNFLLLRTREAMLL